MYRFFAKPAVIMLASVFLICGCTEVSEEPPAPPVTETSAAEVSPYPVNVGQFTFNEQPETVGSLSPAMTEIICELGYSDKITGRSSYCDYPESIVSKTELGSSANPDADAIITAATQMYVFAMIHVLLALNYCLAKILPATPAKAKSETSQDANDSQNENAVLDEEESARL